MDPLVYFNQFVLYDFEGFFMTVISSNIRKNRHRPALPHSEPCSTIGDEGLNFRVRDGNGCNPLSIGAVEYHLILTLYLCKSFLVLRTKKLQKNEKKYLI
jgi:hypothetical protein